MSLYQGPRQLLMIDLDQPSYQACAVAGGLVGLSPIYALSRALAIVARPSDVAAVVVDVQTCVDTFKAFACLQDRLPFSPIVVITGRDEPAQARLALRMGAIHAIQKPCDPSELDRIFRFILANREPGTVLCASALAARQQPAPSGHLPLAELERRAIVGAVKLANGDKLRAAKILGIGKTTMYRRLKQYARERRSEGMMGD